MFKVAWLLQARAGIWIQFFDFTSSTEVCLPYCLLNSLLHHLSVLTSNFPLSSPPLLLPPPTGLRLPGPQMPSSQVICFAKILFWFDKLWRGQLTQHDSARENSEPACSACRASELRQDGRRRNLSLTDGSTRLSPWARCQGQHLLFAVGRAGARSCDSHMRGCVCACVATYGAGVGQAVSHSGPTFVGGRFVRPCVSVCVQMNVFVCAWLHVCGCVRCIRIWILSLHSCWYVCSRTWERRVQCLEKSTFCMSWSAMGTQTFCKHPAPALSSLQNGVTWVAVQVTSFPRWSRSSELRFRFLKTTSW